MWDVERSEVTKLARNRCCTVTPQHVVQQRFLHSNSCIILYYIRCAWLSESWRMLSVVRMLYITLLHTTTPACYVKALCWLIWFCVKRQSQQNDGSSSKQYFRISVRIRGAIESVCRLLCARAAEGSKITVEKGGDGTSPVRTLRIVLHASFIEGYRSIVRCCLPGSAVRQTETTSSQCNRVTMRICCLLLCLLLQRMKRQLSKLMLSKVTHE